MPSLLVRFSAALQAFAQAGSTAAMKNNSHTTEATTMDQTLSLPTLWPQLQNTPNPAQQLVSQMPETKQLVLRAATRKLFDKSYFDICTVDALMKLVGTTARPAAYTQLNALHCVHYGDMPNELRDRIPYLVRECLAGQTADEAASIVLG